MTRGRRRWGWWAAADDPVFVVPCEAAPRISMVECTRDQARSYGYEHKLTCGSVVNGDASSPTAKFSLFSGDRAFENVWLIDTGFF